MGLIVSSTWGRVCFQEAQTKQLPFEKSVCFADVRRSTYLLNDGLN